MADTNTDNSTSTEGAIPTINTLDNRQFHRFDMTIGELPTSYLDSMTYYEMLAWFCNYLHKIVVPKINELTGGVNKLSQYVEEYIQKVEQLYKDWDAYQKDLNKQWSDYKTNLNTEWSDYKTDLNKQWSDYKTNLNTEWANYKTDLNKQWSDYKTNLNTEWANYKKQFEATYKEFTTNINNEISQLKTDWNTYKTNLNTEWSDYKTTTTNDLNTKFDNEVKDIESKFSTLQTALEARVKTLEDGADARIAAKEKEVDDYLVNLPTEVKGDVKEEITSLVNDGSIKQYVDEILGDTIDGSKLVDGTVSASKLASGVVNNNKITIQAAGIGTNKASTSFTLNQSSDATITPVFGGGNIANGSIPESAMGWKNMVDYDTGVETFQNSITIFTREGADASKTLSRWDHEANAYVNFKVLRSNGVGMFIHGINTRKASHVHGWLSVNIPAGDHYVGLAGLAKSSNVYTDTWGIYNGSFAGEALTRVVDGTNTIDGLTYAYGSPGHYFNAGESAVMTIRYDLIKSHPHTDNTTWNFTYDAISNNITKRWGMHSNGVCIALDAHTIPGFYIRGVSTENSWNGEHQMTIDYNFDADITSAKQNTFTFDEEEEA